MTCLMCWTSVHGHIINLLDTSSKLSLKWGGGSKLKRNTNRGTKKLIFKIGRLKLNFFQNRGPKLHLNLLFK
jgi:hypothetical protein